MHFSILRACSLSSATLALNQVFHLYRLGPSRLKRRSANSFSEVNFTLAAKGKHHDNSEIFNFRNSVVLSYFKAIQGPVEASSSSHASPSAFKARWRLLGPQRQLGP